MEPAATLNTFQYIMGKYNAKQEVLIFYGFVL